MRRFLPMPAPRRAHPPPPAPAEPPVETETETEPKAQAETETPDPAPYPTLAVFPDGGVIPHLDAACLKACAMGFSPGVSWKNMPRRAKTGDPALGVGVPSVGSGKSGSPLARMHSANLTALRRSLADIFGGVAGPGAYFEHAFRADWNDGDWGLSPDPGASQRPPPAPGSGKFENPWARMQFENLSACAKWGSPALWLCEEPHAVRARTHTTAAQTIESDLVIGAAMCTPP